MIVLVALATGCNSVTQKQALQNQVKRDTHGVDAEILTFDSATQVATVRYHHRIVYGKTSSVRYRFDGSKWQRIKGASNNVLENIGTNAPNSQH